MARNQGRSHGLGYLRMTKSRPYGRLLVFMAVRRQQLFF